jgi:hypothetical protein
VFSVQGLGSVFSVQGLGFRVWVNLDGSACLEARGTIVDALRTGQAQAGALGAGVVLDEARAAVCEEARHEPDKNLEKVSVLVDVLYKVTI